MSRHLMAKMRRPLVARHKTAESAEPTEFHYHSDPHEPHGWQEHPLWTKDEIYSDVNMRQNIIPRAQHNLTTLDWHPSIGETHVRYSVDPSFEGSKAGEPTGWRAVHYGPYQGHREVTFEGETEPELWPKYHRNKDDFVVLSDDGSDRFSSREEAMLAVIDHFDRTYGDGKHKPGADYYDKIMNNLPEIDDDYGDIFGGDK